MEENKNGKICKFTDLIAWQEAHRLVLIIYEAVKKFPSSEKFVLSNQITRAVISISSNIAEGFARESWSDKNRFYNIAQTSLIEVQNQLIIARDLNYLKNAEFLEVSKQTVVCHKLIIGLMKSCKKRNN